MRAPAAGRLPRPRPTCGPMTALPRRPVGRTPLSVSVLGFGAAPLGGLYREVSGVDARAAVEATLAAGVTYFDTAPLYGHGLSEHRLGEALRAIPRDGFVLSTKVGRLLRPVRTAPPSDGLFADPLPFEYVYDYSRDGARRSLEDSLQRLGLARIDIALIHDVVPRWHGAEFERRFRESMEGAYPALAELRAAGVVRAIGVGVKDWDVCLRYLGAGDFDCVMLAGQYTLLCQDALPELLPHCARIGGRRAPGRSVQLRHPGHRRRARRAILLPAGLARDPGHARDASRQSAGGTRSRSRRRRSSSPWPMPRWQAWSPGRARGPKSTPTSSSSADRSHPPSGASSRPRACCRRKRRCRSGRVSRDEERAPPPLLPSSRWLFATSRTGTSALP